jgi:hypothetical protein
LVLVHKVCDQKIDLFHIHTQAKVSFDGETKDTAAITGRKESYNFDDDVEFVVDGGKAGRADDVTIEIWDVHWKNALLGVCTIPFARIKEDMYVHDTLDLVGQKRGKVEVVCEWLGMMEGG